MSKLCLQENSFKYFRTQAIAFWAPEAVYPKTQFDTMCSNNFILSSSWKFADSKENFGQKH